MFITTATAATVTELGICTRESAMFAAGVSLVLVAFVVLVVALASLRPCWCYWNQKLRFRLVVIILDYIHIPKILPFQCLTKLLRSVWFIQVNLQLHFKHKLCSSLLTVTIRVCDVCICVHECVLFSIIITTIKELKCGHVLDINNIIII